MKKRQKEVDEIRKGLQEMLKQRENRLSEARKRLQANSQRQISQKRFHESQGKEEEEANDLEEEFEDGDQYALEDYNSDNESSAKAKNDSNAAEVEITPKIFICSRTHSQLAQLVNELRKTVHASTMRSIVLGKKSYKYGERNNFLQSLKLTTRLHVFSV